MKRDPTDSSRSYVVCHMLTSLDGKIDGSFMSAFENAPMAEKYGEIRDFYDCQATLYGTTTMAGGFSDGLAPKLPVGTVHYSQEDYAAQSDVNNYIVSIDTEGILGWQSKYIEKKNRPRAHVIEVLTEQVSNDYLAYLHALDISYIFAGSEQLDCKVLLTKLKNLFRIDRLMVAGGGLINWSFLQEDLIDELSLVISPLADGNRTAVSIFEKADFLPDRLPVAFSLKEIDKIEDNGLWLRYQPKQ